MLVKKFYETGNCKSLKIPKRKFQLCLEYRKSNEIINFLKELRNKVNKIEICRNSGNKRNIIIKNLSKHIELEFIFIYQRLTQFIIFCLIIAFNLLIFYS